MGAPVSDRRRGAGRGMETAAPPGSAEPRQPSEIYKLNRLSCSTQVGRNVNITLRTVSKRRETLIRLGLGSHATRPSFLGTTC